MSPERSMQREVWPSHREGIIIHARRKSVKPWPVQPRFAVDGSGFQLRRLLVTKRLLAPPRSTLYLSAGLLLLPATGFAQSAGGWSCKPDASGLWQCDGTAAPAQIAPVSVSEDRKSTRLNSSHVKI